MKKIIYALVFATSFVFASCPYCLKEHSAIEHMNLHSHHAHKHHKHHGKAAKHPVSQLILDLMHGAMMKTTFVESKDVEKDFLANMIPHHQGAIDSSKELLKHTKNETLKQIANNIIKAQEAEIKEFSDILNKKDYKQTKISDKDYEKFVTDEKAIMHRMMSSMHSVKPSSDIDKDFLKAMIEHHQGAVDVSKQILEYSKDEKVREIASRIIKDQEKEIKDFQELLQK